MAKLSADRWNVTVTSGSNGNFNSLFDQQANKITTFVRNDEFQSKFEQEAKSIRLEANQIYINGATFDSNSTMTLTAGNIGGWRVASQQLYAGSGAYRVGMQSIATSGSVSFYAGSETPTNAPFRVTNTGTVYASSFQGMGYVEAEKGKIGQWWIYPTDESYYKKWVVTEYEMTEYDKNRRGDIWTSGTWQENSYSTTSHTYYISLHVPNQNDFDEYLYTFYSGFETTGSNHDGNSMMCAISYLGNVFCGAVYEAVYINNGHSETINPSYGQNLCAMLNTGRVIATDSFRAYNFDYHNNNYSIELNGHQIISYLNGTICCTMTFGTNGNITINGDLYVRGNTSAKDRIIDTKHFNSVGLAAYETTSPMFGDVGESYIGANGSVRIYIDPVFAETVVLQDAYQVFLQKYGAGECYVSERNSTYFVVEGTPGLKFGWEMKAKQIGVDQQRLYRFDMLNNEQAVGNHNFTDEADHINASATDYGAQGAQYVQEQSA